MSDPAESRLDTIDRQQIFALQLLEFLIRYSPWKEKIDSPGIMHDFYALCVVIHSERDVTSFTYEQKFESDNYI